MYYFHRGTAAAHWCNTTNWSELFRGGSVARGHLIQAFTRVWQFSEVGLLRKLVCERFVFILCASTKRYWTSYELGNFSCKHFASLLYSRHLLCLRRELLGFHEKPPGSWLVFRYGGMWPRHIEILYYIFCTVIISQITRLFTRSIVKHRKYQLLKLSSYFYVIIVNTTWFVWVFRKNNTVMIFECLKFSFEKERSWEKF